MMNLSGMAETAVYGSSMGLSMGGALLIVRWIVTFMADRTDKKEELLDTRTAALIRGLESRLDEEKESRLDEIQRRIAVEEELRAALRSVQAELEECTRRHGESEAEVARLSRLMMAQGE